MSLLPKLKAGSPSGRLVENIADWHLIEDQGWRHGVEFDFKPFVEPFYERKVIRFKEAGLFAYSG
jgi:hypothetical protein